MVTKQIFNLAQKSRKGTTFTLLQQPFRSASSSTALADSETSPQPPSPQPPNAPRRRRIDRAVKSKPRQPKNPDPRFTQHGSPHPVLIDHTRILSVPETRLTTLPNGLRVGTESYLSTRTATVGAWIDAGSRHESEETNGTAHFLEHVLFKGTWRRRNFEDLAMEIETMGGRLDACTSRENSVYYMRVMAGDVMKAIDILGDMLQNASLSRAVINEEREQIMEEMEQADTVPEERLFDILQSVAFGNCSLGRTILGPVENIQRITRADIQNFYVTQYTAPRMVIAAAGAVKHEDIVQQVSRHFKKLSRDPTTASELAAKDPAVFTGSEKRIVDDKYRLAHCVIAFRGASWTDSDCIALLVMEYLLGSWKKKNKSGKQIRSELARRIEDNELAESMKAFNNNFTDNGLFGVYVTAEPGCLDELAYVIMHELSKLSYSVSEDDVTRACNQLKTELLRECIGSTGVATDIGCQLLRYGRRMPYTELLARIDAVDANTVKRVANRFIYDKDIAIAALGPIQNLPDYHWFRRKTCWKRS